MLEKNNQWMTKTDVLDRLNISEAKLRSILQENLIEKRDYGNNRYLRADVEAIAWRWEIDRRRSKTTQVS